MTVAVIYVTCVCILMCLLRMCTFLYACVCVLVCVHVCVRACVRTCVRVNCVHSCVCVSFIYLLRLIKVINKLDSYNSLNFPNSAGD